MKPRQSTLETHPVKDIGTGKRAVPDSSSSLFPGFYTFSVGESRTSQRIRRALSTLTGFLRGKELKRPETAAGPSFRGDLYKSGDFLELLPDNRSKQKQELSSAERQER